VSLIGVVKALLGAKDLAQHQLGHLQDVLVELREDDYNGCWSVVKNFGSMKDVMTEAAAGLAKVGVPEMLVGPAVDVVAPLILKALDSVIPEEQLLAILEPLLKL